MASAMGEMGGSEKRPNHGVSGAGIAAKMKAQRRVVFCFFAGWRMKGARRSKKAKKPEADSLNCSEKPGAWPYPRRRLGPGSPPPKKKMKN
jgi:hypothetical protein